MAREMPETMDTESNFETAFLGYNRRQVDRHIAELHQYAAEAAAAFDTAIAVQQQLNEANQEIVRLRERIRYANGGNVGDRITTILRVAEEQAEAIRNQAEDDVRARNGKRRHARHR